MLGERGRANPALASIEVATVTVTPHSPLLFFQQRFLGRAEPELSGQQLRMRLRVLLASHCPSGGVGE